mmetsp:Transcript_10810/g.30676  ORF Transcript_10810/g.30676 Transcript_10810/m.30676 type:complete len:208 (+) Transcript_10810:1489-2112(+)
MMTCVILSFSSLISMGEPSPSQHTSPPNDFTINTMASRGHSRLMRNVKPLNKFARLLRSKINNSRSVKFAFCSSSIIVVAICALASSPEVIISMFSSIRNCSFSRSLSRSAASLSAISSSSSPSSNCAISFSFSANVFFLFFGFSPCSIAAFSFEPVAVAFSLACATNAAFSIFLFNSCTIATAPVAASSKATSNTGGYLKLSSWYN